MKNNYKGWDVYVSNQITDHEYSKGKVFEEMSKRFNCKIIEDLHLYVSLRSLRNKNIDAIVKSLLDVAFPILDDNVLLNMKILAWKLVPKQYA